MQDNPPLVQRLRTQILSSLHVGQVRPGDRLPSIRQVASETHEDPRAVAQAYRILEAEHLVEVRHRSGIYAAPPPHAAPVQQATAQWAARVMVDGWRRGIPVQELGAFINARTTLRQLRSIFVESSDDVLTAFTWELREHFGMDAHAVRVGALREHGRRGTPATSADSRAIRGADLVVTTPFHAAEVAPVAATLGMPLVVTTLNTEMVAAIGRQLRQGGLTVICVDPGFRDRLQVQYGRWITPSTRLRILHPEDARAIAALDPAEPVLVTRAAHRLLGAVHFRLVYPHSPTISTDSAHELIEHVIRHNLAAAAEPQRGSR